MSCLNIITVESNKICIFDLMKNFGLIKYEKNFIYNTFGKTNVIHFSMILSNASYIRI